MALETPDNLAAGLVYDWRTPTQQPPNQTAQITGYVNVDVDALDWVPNNVDDALQVPLVDPVDPATAVVFASPIGGQLSAFLTPLPNPFGDPDIDNLPDYTLVWGVVAGAPGIYASVLVFEVNSEPGEVVTP